MSYFIQTLWSPQKWARAKEMRDFAGRMRPHRADLSRVQDRPHQCDAAPRAWLSQMAASQFARRDSSDEYTAMRGAEGMTVYVDDMHSTGMGRHGRMKMSHMIADTDAELLAMADRIGVARRWHQGDHYDIALSKRTMAISSGARSITLRQLAFMAMNRRRRGLPLGTPEEAQAVIDQKWRDAGREPPAQ
jgi:hypothetical protein